MLETLFHKQKQKVEEVPHTHKSKEAAIFLQEENRQKNFFKRKKINPHILYNTLLYIAPFFDHREDDWEKFLMFIVRENERRRPRFIKIGTWFHETFQETNGSLNHSETKYLCRYVKMSCMSTDRESKLREAMDNIDLPPVKYDSWVNEVFTLECDDIADITEAEAGPSRNYFKEAFDSVVTTVGVLHSSYVNRIGKTHPENPRTLKRQISNTRLSFSSKPTRSRYKTTGNMSTSFSGSSLLSDDTTTKESNADGEGGDNHIRKFSQPLLLPQLSH